MKRNTLMALFAVLFTASAYGQIFKPVTWSYAAKKTGANTATVFIKASIDKNWHIYSQFLKPGGPNPTRFSFLSSKNYILLGKTIEPNPHSVFEPSFKMQVSYFENSVVFQQKVKLLTKNTTIKGKLEFMACDDHQCLPPEEVEFSVPIK